MSRRVTTLALVFALGAGTLGAPSPALARPADRIAVERARAHGLSEPKPAREPEQAKTPQKSSKVSAKKKDSAPKTLCYADQVTVVRKRGDDIEQRKLALTFCDGAPNPSALDSISVLARPRDVERPFMPEIKAYQQRPLDRGRAGRRRLPNYLSEHVMRVHPGLLVRLQRAANRFPGKTIEVISGHRPHARDTSRHHHGRALDMRIEGVSREVLRDFLRTLDETGVGYYPNGYFVHMDVRDDKGYWVDRSGPGEPADYGPWPPRREEIERTRERVVARALAELSALREPIGSVSGSSVEPREERASDAPRTAQADAEPDETMHEDDELSAEEVRRIRAEAMQALEGLTIPAP